MNSILTQIEVNRVEICAVIIALCALILSIWESRLNRKHQKLMVTPHIEIHRTVNSLDQFFKVIIKNEGLGPAFITSILFVYKNQEIDLIDLRKFSSDLTNDSTLNFFELDGETILKEGKEIYYLDINFKKSKKLSEEELKTFSKSIEITINYKSAYKESYFTTG